MDVLLWKKKNKIKNRERERERGIFPPRLKDLRNSNCLIKQKMILSRKDKL